MKSPQTVEQYERFWKISILLPNPVQLMLSCTQIQTLQKYIVRFTRLYMLTASELLPSIHKGWGTIWHRCHLLEEMAYCF